jgi:uncharacterized repeat protein (TIGR03803 family)
MCHTTRRIALFFGFTFLLAVLSNTLQAQTETVIYDIGGYPLSGVTLGTQGTIYGTTPYGGAHSGGEVYRLERSNGTWAFSRLYSFGYMDQDGSNPYASVVFGPDGLLYGTTSADGAYGGGTVFSLRPPASRTCGTAQCSWIETTLFNFSGGADGGYPGYGNLVFDQAGNMYGTTYSGGSSGGGVVFKLTRSGSGWAESVIWNFGNGSGYDPISGVIFDSAGNLYGTTPGSVYELSPTQSGWTETTLSAEVGGYGGLTFDTHGNLFGITGSGPQGGNAEVYELTPQNGSWSLSMLENFGDQYFGPAAAPTFDARGNLYGPLPNTTTNPAGEIFKLAPSGNQWIYSSYYQFTGGSGGNMPVGAVTFDASGNMYGTTIGEGGHAVVWEITP